jgi:hypothetical protein
MKHVSENLIEIFEGVFPGKHHSGRYSRTMVQSGTLSHIHFAAEYHDDNRGLLVYSNLENFTIRLEQDELANLTPTEIAQALRGRIATHFFLRAKSFL